jgi:hypothetical protein
MSLRDDQEWTVLKVRFRRKRRLRAFAEGLAFGALAGTLTLAILLPVLTMIGGGR